MVHAQTEAFGFPKTWDAAIRVTKPGGRVANIGYHGENPKPLEVPLKPFGMGMADKQIYGGLCSGGSERLHHIFRLGRDRDGVRHDAEQRRRHHKALIHLD